MIYKKNVIAELLIISLLIFIAQLSCIQNPVRHDLESGQSEKKQVPPLINFSSIVQDKNGVLWGLLNNRVYIWNEKTSTQSFAVDLEDYYGSSDLLLDRQGSVLILYDNILGRISEKQGNYFVDTLKALSLSTVFEKYTTDYSGNVWLYDNTISGIVLIKWDGNKVTEYLLNEYIEPESFLSNGFIAGGNNYVYFLYKSTAGWIVVGKFKEGDSTFKSNSYTIDSVPFIVQQVFALNDKLDIIIETSQRTISGGNVIIKSKHLLMEIDDNRIRKRQELAGYYFKDKIRSGPDELYFNFYNGNQLSKITSTSVVEKKTTIECSDLFIDTSGAVILYSNSTGKMINVSSLPGF
jgi:hypothetical protein